jgi:hypothetical protein
VDVYRIALAGQDFGVGLSYATGTSSAGAAHDNGECSLTA